MNIDVGKLKTLFNNSVPSNSTFLGKYVMEKLNEAIEVSEVLGSESIKTTKIKKGDVLNLKITNKTRPHVVISVKKDYVIVLSLTTTNDYNSTGIPHNSRFMEHGYFSHTLSIVKTEIALATFVNVLDSNTQLNKAIRYVKDFYDKQI